ncbi:MAG TPA: thymidine phosphorylase [Actinomycetota bacterium]|jgi:pyrimidine-nucleoside phosphorylase|nr:thymidine phosphorylase [Actinomycetota bacterium]
MTHWDPREIVAAKRDGRTLAGGEIQAFVEGFTRGDVSDALAASFLMASLIRGLDADETLALTRAMVDSGDTVTFEAVRAPTVDKHSTGGVADGVTLVFAPVAAALGLAVAKLSGRGLGHTGGTLDKLEAIPGLRTDLTPREIEHQVEAIGCAVAAQSPNLVPADGALYALRDATATVPSIPLIAASVMSKKLAVATDLILLDVKAGSGAFMKTPEDAESLARACLDLASGWGRSASAAVTDMSQPLGDAVGNALDVAEAVALLRGEAHGRLQELVVLFAARAAASLPDLPTDDARSKAESTISSGEALERFRRMVEAQGGDPRVVDDPATVLPRAAVVVPLLADRTGTLAAVDAEEIGLASGALGAGRVSKGDPIDPAVGIVFHPKIGDVLEADAPVGEIHAQTEDAATEAKRRVLAALTITEGPVEAPPLVYGWLD